MEKQNVTLALPRDLLKRVKIMAAEKDTSILALLGGSPAGTAGSTRGVCTSPDAADKSDEPGEQSWNPGRTDLDTERAA